MTALPYLQLDDIEVGNALRTLTYLRRGLAGSRFSVNIDGSVVVEPECRDVLSGDTYHTTYPTGYPGTVEHVCDPIDPFDPRFLRCYCSELDGRPYVDPATDGAPWYDPLRPESADFLGFIPDDINVRPTLTRGISQGTRGGTLGLQRIGGAIAAVSGTLYASGPEGMEYGQRWLEQMLSLRFDEPPNMRFLPACPQDAAARWRNLPRVGLVDGPTPAPIQDVPPAVVLPLAFQLASESPWQLSDAETVLDTDGFFLDGSVVLDLPAVQGPGDQGLVIYLDARNGTIPDDVTFELRGRSSAQTCGSSGLPILWSATITSLGESYALIIDANDENVGVYAIATGDVLCGLDCLHYTAPWHFPALPAGQAGCLRIFGALDNAHVTVQRRQREV